MSYHIYQTEGFILGSSAQGESSRYITIFTEELGLVRAMAQSVRAVQSKLRHSLQDFSYSKISFVRGKEIWRIVNAEKLFLLEKLSQGQKEMVAKIAMVLKRFVGAEDKDPLLWKEIKSALVFLDEEKMGEDEFKKFELVFLLRTMNLLGYFEPELKEEKLREIVGMDGYSAEILQKTTGIEKNITTIINRAFSESHL